MVDDDIGIDSGMSRLGRAAILENEVEDDAEDFGLKYLNSEFDNE